MRSFTLNRPTSFCLNRNCLFKLLMSIVSMSITSIFLKPISARSFNNSHPNPPAPTTRTRTNSCKALNISSDGSKLSPLKGPLRFNNFWTWFHLPGQSCCSLSKISLFIFYGALLLKVSVMEFGKWQILILFDKYLADAGTIDLAIGCCIHFTVYFHCWQRYIYFYIQIF